MSSWQEQFDYTEEDRIKLLEGSHLFLDGDTMSPQWDWLWIYQKKHMIYELYVSTHWEYCRKEGLIIQKPLGMFMSDDEFKIKLISILKKC